MTPASDTARVFVDRDLYTRVGDPTVSQAHSEVSSVALPLWQHTHMQGGCIWHWVEKKTPSPSQEHRYKLMGGWMRSSRAMSIGLKASRVGSTARAGNWLLSITLLPPTSSDSYRARMSIKSCYWQPQWTGGVPSCKPRRLLAEYLSVANRAGLQ